MATTTTDQETGAEAEATVLDPDARAKFEDSRHLRQMALCFGPIADEMKVKVKRDGLHAEGVDAAHVLMGRLKVKPEALEAYTVGEEGKTLVDTDRLLQSAKSFSLGDPATLRFRASDRNLSAEQGRVSREAPYMDPSSVTDPNVPDLDLPAKATVPDIGELQNFIKHVEKETSELVEVTVSSVNGLKIEGTGDQATDKYEVDREEIDLPRSFTLGDPSQVSAKFSCDYLASVLKVAKKLDTGTEASLRLYVNEDYPIRLVLENGPIRATYLIAPRIESA